MESNCIRPKGKKHAIMGIEIGRLGWWGAILGFVAVPLFSIIYQYWFGVTHEYLLSSDPEVWAQFGDYLAGTAGPIIGFASILLLVATLQLQREELQEQRAELRRATEEAAHQSNVLFIQGFEQSLFSWLKDYGDQRQAVEYYDGSMTSSVTGVKAIRRIVSNALAPITEASTRSLPPEKLVLALNKVIGEWDNQFKVKEDELGALLRVLYRLLKWIDEQERLLEDQKQHYVRIVRARLSNAELRMLFLNALSRRGANYISLINRYSLFDNLPDPDVWVVEFQKKYGQSPFQASAFHTPSIKQPEADTSRTPSQC